VLHAEELSYLDEGKELFSGLTFTLTAGHWIEVIGPNGSGKSSLLRMLVGLLPLASGTLQWAGKIVHFPDYRYARDIAYIGHKIAVQSRLTPRENLIWWLRLQKGTWKGMASLLELILVAWDLKQCAEIPCERLSAGQCQRVALARLMLQTRPLWVLDEPATALDTVALRLFESLLQLHLQSGGMAVIASHLRFQLEAHKKNSIELGQIASC